MEKLTCDIIRDILSRLPIKSLLRCRCVCKFWLNLTRDSHFVDIHLLSRSQDENNLSLILKSSIPINRAYSHTKLSFLDNDGSSDYACANISFSLPYYHSYEVMGSCNGLICLFDPSRKSLTHILNPCTGEYVSLPNLITTSYAPNDVVVGFGYSLRQKKYKAIEIVYYNALSSGGFRSEVHVYTLGESCWRQIGDSPYSLRGKCTSEAFVNGCLHWVSCGYDGPNLVDRIIAFDVTEESFKIIPHPNFESWRLNYSLGVLRGCLSSTNYKFQHFVEIWVMNEYGLEESWSKCYKITCSEVGVIGYFQPLCIQRNEEVLLLYGGILLSYHPITKRLRELRIAGLPHSFKAFTHVGSLVSSQRSDNK